MGDIADNAQHEVDSLRQQALLKHQRRVEAEPKREPGDSPDCCDCTGEIEPARLLAVPDARRCFECQKRAERKAKPAWMR